MRKPCRIPAAPSAPGATPALAAAVTGANEPAPEYYRLRVDAAKGWQKYPLALRAGDRVPLVRRAAVAVLGTMGEASDLALVEAELQGPDRLLAVAARAAAEKIRARAAAPARNVE